MLWLWIPLGVLATAALTCVVVVVHYCCQIKRRYMDRIARIFVEKPLFIIPRGEPVAGAEDVRMTTPEGLTLRGCYLRSTLPRRQGVIFFGLEFGSNRWACVPYTQSLRAAGFDIFTFEPRSQADSDKQHGYEPLQWVTDYEVDDFRTALAYLKTRPDADPGGIGFFGISKGGGAGVLAAARDPFVRCFVTDGIFATHMTMLPYMRKWVSIYSDRAYLHNLLPDFVYRRFACACLRRIRRERGVRFPHLECAIRKLKRRPLLMIHGGADTYIKPEMAQALFDRARAPKELWLVEGAKHNQAVHVANGEYQRRVLEFFQRHLGTGVPPVQLEEAVHAERVSPEFWELTESK